MAFGKKKKDDQAAPQAGEPAPDDAADEAVGASMFAGSDAAPPQDDAIAAALVAEEAATASADPLSSDLLNMFQTTQIEAVDLSAILDLAGDVEIDDLLEELHTIALALGVRLEAIDDYEELAA
jgi:hypothetical protein